MVDRMGSPECSRKTGRRQAGCPTSWPSSLGVWTVGQDAVNCAADVERSRRLLATATMT
jgi:hypothetical protein